MRLAFMIGTLALACPYSTMDPGEPEGIAPELEYLTEARLSADGTLVMPLLYPARSPMLWEK